MLQSRLALTSAAGKAKGCDVTPGSRPHSEKVPDLRRGAVEVGMRAGRGRGGWVGGWVGGAAGQRGSSRRPGGRAPRAVCD